MAIAVLVFAASAIGDGELDGDLVAEKEPRLEETDGELELGWRHGTGCGGLGRSPGPGAQRQHERQGYEKLRCGAALRRSGRKQRPDASAPRKRTGGPGLP